MRSRDSTPCGVAMVEPLENRQLLSVSVAFNDNLAAVFESPRSSSRSSRFEGIYTGVVRLTRVDPGATGEVGDRLDATLQMNGRDAGVIDATFDVEGLDTYSAIGVPHGNRIKFFLTGSDEGTLMLRFGRGSRLLAGTFKHGSGDAFATGKVRLVRQRDDVLTSRLASLGTGGIGGNPNGVLNVNKRGVLSEDGGVLALGRKGVFNTDSLIL